MSTSVVNVEEIDLQISVAFLELGAARGVFTRCPSTENGRRAAEAEAEVNRLLDLRLAAAR